MRQTKSNFFINTNFTSAERMRKLTETTDGIVRCEVVDGDLFITVTRGSDNSYTGTVTVAENSLDSHNFNASDSVCSLTIGTKNCDASALVAHLRNATQLFEISIIKNSTNVFYVDVTRYIVK